MRRVLFCLSLAAGIPGLASAQPATGPLQTPAKPSDGPVRNFILRNEAKQAITSAEVNTTGGKHAVLTENGRITTNQRHTFQISTDDCVGAVSITFADGRRIRSDLNDCKEPNIVVHDDHVAAASSAVPGTTVTPGEGARGTQEHR